MPAFAAPLAYATPPIAIFAVWHPCNSRYRPVYCEWSACGEFSESRTAGGPRWKRGRTVRHLPAAWRGTLRDVDVTFSRQVERLRPRQLGFPHTVQIARRGCREREALEFRALPHNDANLLLHSTLPPSRPHPALLGTRIAEYRSESVRSGPANVDSTAWHDSSAEP